MVECQPSLTGLEATQCRHIDARPARDLFQCETTLHAQVTEPPAHPLIDAVLVICLHGK